MPYIKTEDYDRARLAPENAGELNFAITKLLIEYWERKGHRYQTISDITGACSGALHEFERRVVGKYEDQKIKENGDVYHG